MYRGFRIQDICHFTSRNIVYHPFYFQGYGILGAPGVLGIWGEWIFIFRELRSTGYYFRGAGELAHTKVKNKFIKSHLKGKIHYFFLNAFIIELTVW